MLAEGDAPSWWSLSDVEWFEIIIFFLTAPYEFLSAATKSKSEIG
jgi:hypothetical protein